MNRFIAVNKTCQCYSSPPIIYSACFFHSYIYSYRPSVLQWILLIEISQKLLHAPLVSTCFQNLRSHQRHSNKLNIPLQGTVDQFKFSKPDHLSAGFTSTFTSQLADTDLKPQTLLNSSLNWSPITQPCFSSTASFLLFPLFACNLPCTHTLVSLTASGKSFKIPP